MLVLNYDYSVHVKSYCLAVQSVIFLKKKIYCIVSAGKLFSNTNLSDLSIVGTSDKFVYQMRHKVM